MCVYLVIIHEIYIVGQRRRLRYLVTLQEPKGSFMRTILLVVFCVLSVTSWASMSNLEEFQLVEGSSRCFPGEYLFVYTSEDGYLMRLDQRVGDQIITIADFNFDLINLGSFENTVTTGTGEAIPVVETNTMEVTDEGERFTSTRIAYSDLYQRVVMNFNPGTLSIAISGNGFEDASCDYQAVGEWIEKTE